jgi:hypothetical protein
MALWLTSIAEEIPRQSRLEAQAMEAVLVIIRTENHLKYIIRRRGR